ncbi:MAG: hypothetical protein FJX76_00105 [Armatimonadetes bacterium]|nr:hypothetical protein [Armatimonadota bacterium]
MAFDIRQRLGGEEVAWRYQNSLVEQFLASPEAERAGVRAGNYAYDLLEFAWNYEGVTPVTMQPANLREVVFNLFPRKITCFPDEAANIVPEVRAFLQFLSRAFSLANADRCLKCLDDGAVEQLRRALDDPRNYGMAKSVLMKGLREGADFSTPEKLEAWLARQSGGVFPPRHLEQPDIQMVDDPYMLQAASRSPRRGADKGRRKMQKASRRRNR